MHSEGTFARLEDEDMKTVKEYGVMDVIVVQRPDGSRGCTPFYIKFSGSDISKCQNPIVEIYINRIKTSLCMELDRNGEGKFRREFPGASLIMSQLENPEEIKGVTSDPISFSLSIPQDSSPVPEVCDDYSKSSENSTGMITDESSVETFHPSKVSEEVSKTVSPPKSPVLEESKESGPERDLEAGSKEGSPTRLEECKLNPQCPEIPRRKSYVMNGIDEGDLKYNLSREELGGLPLHLGVNTMHFIIRGHKPIHHIGKMFLWESTDKIVISDVDGTITKSDILGHIFELFGKDWTKGGAVYLYNILSHRGYKILYLTARSLDQLSFTRTYLAKITEDGEKLPIGPLILNPTGLWNSLVSEISKKSKDFKATILDIIKDLFPANYMPFYAGFGNREGDAIAYAQAGVPLNHIYIINKKNKEKGEFVSLKNFKDNKLRIDASFPRINNIEE